MMKSCKKQAGRFAVRIMLSLSLFLFISLTAHAQEDEPQTDTVLTVETPSGIAVPVEESGDIADKFLKKGTLRNGDRAMTVRHFPKGMIDSVKKQEEYWYADYDFSDRKKNSNSVVYNNDDRPESDSAKGVKGKTGDQYEEDKFTHSKRNEKEGSGWASTLIWIILIAAFITILGWLLGNSNMQLFGKKKVSIKEEEQEEDIPENIFEINYEKEIARAEKDNNYRLAIRLYFLRLLRDMNNRQIIRYRQNKTNFDYLSELYGSAYYPNFFTIVRHYEFAWYGKFFISDSQYEVVKNEVSSFNKQGGIN